MMYGFYVPLAEQTIWFFYSIVIGLFLGLIYSVMQGISVWFTKKTIIIALLDLSFFAIVSAAEFGLLMFMPNGKIRWFHITGQLMGFFLFILLFHSKIRSLFLLVQKKLHLRIVHIKCLKNNKNNLK